MFFSLKKIICFYFIVMISSSCSIKTIPITDNDLSNIKHEQRKFIEKEYGFLSNKEYIHKYTKILSDIEKKIRNSSQIFDDIGTIGFTIINYDTALSDTGNNIYIGSYAFDKYDNSEWTESELAAIVSHEMAHIYKKHGINQINKKTIKTSINLDTIYIAKTIDSKILPYYLTSLIFGKNTYKNYFESPDISQNKLEPYELKITEGTFLFSKDIEPLFLSDYSIDQEVEADMIAIKWLIEAGYNPYSLIKVLNTNRKDQDTDQRIQKINEFLRTTKPWSEK